MRQEIKLLANMIANRHQARPSTETNRKLFTAAANSDLNLKTR